MHLPSSEPTADPVAAPASPRPLDEVALAVPVPGAPNPRAMVLVTSAFLVVLLLALLFVVPVPYAVLGPGPVFNTLGSTQGQPLIEVAGHPSYRDRGQLDLTTVSVQGGPRSPVFLPVALVGWLHPDEEVPPVWAQFPRGQTADQARRQDAALMASSQENAKAAALGELGIEFSTTAIALLPRLPAARAVRAGDVLLAVDGHRTTDVGELRRLMSAVKAGQTVQLTVRRAGRQLRLPVTTSAGPAGEALIGVELDPSYRFPFSIRIGIDNIGGPSAGTMFALGIIDTLTPGSLTGGQRIAGTGTISAAGGVGAIGGIRHKMVGARRAGAQWFLAPAANCAEVVDHVPAGLHVVRVRTLSEAMDAVQRIAAHRDTGSLPACTR